MMPYRVLTNNIAFNGYNWNPNKYLNPIAFDHFRLTTAEEGSSDYTTSAIYQNPGWKIETNSLPEYSHDTSWRAIPNFWERSPAFFMNIQI